jgi:hypothetical protein
MNTCYVVRSSRPEGLFSFGLLNGLTVRLRRPYLREAPAGFGLERLATAFMNNPGFRFLRELCAGSPPPTRETTSFQQGGTKMATNNKPTHTLRCGNIKATIWENTSEKGPFFSTTFSRPFKDQSGAWRNGTSFGLNDLEALLTVAGEAKEWIAAHALKR